MSNFDMLDAMMRYNPGQSKKTPGDWADSYMESAGLDPKYLKPILEDDSSSLLIASCAGSGKTTSLGLKIIHDLYNLPSANTSVWVGTFLKAGVGDLHDRLKSLSEDPRIPYTTAHNTVHTVDAEMYRVYADYMHSKPQIISEHENSKLLRQVLVQFNRYISYNQVNEIATIINKVENTITDPLKGTPVGTFNGIYSFREQLPLIMKEWRDKREHLDLLTHTDIQLSLLNLLNTTPELHEMLSRKYTHIYLDEFQDISELQFEILKHYMTPDTKVVAVGDDDQSIYSWRGGSVNIITREFQDLYNSKVLHLPINYRCPNNIVDRVRKSIEKNTVRIPKDMRAHVQGGELFLEEFQDLSAMHKFLSLKALEDIKNRKTVAILVRLNRQGLVPALSLGFEPNVAMRASKDIFKKNSKDVQASSGFFDLLSRSAIRNHQYKTARANIVEFLSAVYQGKYTQIHKLIEDAVEYSSSTSVVGVLSTYEDLEFYQRFPSLSSFYQDFKGLVDQDISDYFNIDFLFEAYGRAATKQNIYSNPVFTIIQVMMERITKHDPHSVESARDYLSMILDIGEQSINTEDPNLMISTVHGFKGLEADCVYIWDDSMGNFPHFLAETKEDLEEERRVHYIACTRAREKLTILTTPNPSPYILEMGLKKGQNYA